MRTHTVRAADLDSFVEAGDADLHREQVRQCVKSMFDAGSMRPEWCFVIEEAGRSVGHWPSGRCPAWTSRLTWSCSTLAGKGHANESESTRRRTHQAVRGNTVPIRFRAY